MDKEKLSFLSVIPYIGSILIFLEISRLLLFYAFFDIDILNFVSFEELLVYFMDLLPYGIALICWNYFLKFHLIDSNPDDPADTNPKIKKRINTGVVLLYVMIFLMICFAGIETFRKYKILWFSLLPLCSLGVFFILQWYLKSNSKYISKYNGGVIITIFLFLTIMIINTLKNAIEIKYDGENTGVEILLTNDHKIVSNSSIFYVGKTKDYVFIYNVEMKNCSVIKMDMVQELVFPIK